MASPQVLSGKDASAKLRTQLKDQVSKIQEEHPNFLPSLAIVQVGGREDSSVYIRMKMKAAAEIGIQAQHLHLPRLDPLLVII